MEGTYAHGENYGVWGEGSSRQAKTLYVQVTVDGTLAGNAFACHWAWEGKTICWVTQLVVRKEYRHHGLVEDLLGALKEDVDDVYGIMSSHPAVCLAAGSTFAYSTGLEPMETLRAAREIWNWPLGELPEGHEYLLIMVAKRHRSISLMTKICR
ncbi:hypothetical protein F4825DRAFT_467535 [Nemania diffusa]|nr:hypothetical protein F4825DRAFT_467535 [Nemania diffusa]